ncbi:MAG: ABC transporter ATP-binding protein [Promethearchaeota archaeon]
MSDSYYDEDDEPIDIKFSSIVVRRILSIAWNYKGLLIGLIICTILFSSVDALFGFIVKLIIDEGIIPGNLEALVFYSVLYAIRRVIMAVNVFGFIFCAGRLGRHVQYDLKKQAFNNIQRLSFSEFDKKPVGFFMARLISDVQYVANFITWNLHDLIWTTSTVVASLIYMFIIDWRLSLVILCMFPFMLIIGMKFQKKIIAEYREVRSINSRITSYYNENISGVKIVKGLVREERNLKKFGKLTDNMYRRSYRAVKLSSIFIPLVQLISAIAFGVVLWFGGSEIQKGTFTIGSLQAFITYVTIIAEPINVLAAVYSEMQHGIASAEKIFTLIDTEPEIQDLPNSISIDHIKGEIEYDDVTFYYEEKNPVIKDFSLTVKPGETIALVGPTGGGKTTIANLVCRFYEPKKGRILIDGMDYRQYTQNSLQSHLGVVLQTPHLFSGSIMENIKYGRLEATDEEVYEASKLAHADEFIQRLDKNYEEEVGEKGSLLSQGQKQLVSLARAILSRPSIVIMDEATSSIDSLTEELIQKGMKSLLKDSTSFVIAHRLSTIRSTDRILYIDNGKIVESGTHRELLLQKGRYYNLYTRQFITTNTSIL